MKTRLLICLVIFVCFGASFVKAEEWPQWLGPTRNSVWNEKGIIRQFPKDGPKVLWKSKVSGGFSGPAVAGNKVFVPDFVVKSGDSTNDFNKRDERSGNERLLCFDAKSGDLLWKYEYPVVYKISYASGPRVTPSVVDGKVYGLGAEGNFFCLDVNTGKALWTKDFKKDYNVPTPLWGFCGHPLIKGDFVYCLVGGEGSVAVAFNKDTGKEVWKALSASESGYCPPTLINAAGVDQLLIWDADKLNSLDLVSGKVYWSLPLKPNYGMSVSAPVKDGDLLYAGGIGSIGAGFKLSSDKPGASILWQGTRESALYPCNSTPFAENGVVYGTDCHQGWLGAFKMLSGERLWTDFKPTTGKRTTHGTAFLVKNEDHFYLASETGDLICAKVSPKGYEEISRANLLKPTNAAFNRDVLWSHPAFANKCIYWRNDAELICVSLAE